MTSPIITNQKGFTLVEILVVLAITGMLLAYAIPSFNGFSMRQKLSTETNSFISDLSYARSEAIDKGALVIVESLNGANWEGGWDIYFVLPNGVRENLRMKQNTPGDITITAFPDIDMITYDGQGGLRSDPLTFTIQKNPEFPNFITLSVLPSGMITSSRSF